MSSNNYKEQDKIIDHILLSFFIILIYICILISCNEIINCIYTNNINNLNDIEDEQNGDFLFLDEEENEQNEQNEKIAGEI